MEGDPEISPEGESAGPFWAVSAAEGRGSGLLCPSVGIPRVCCQYLRAMGIGSMLSLLHHARSSPWR
jgi:hypothetical protein